MRSFVIITSALAAVALSTPASNTVHAPSKLPHLHSRTHAISVPRPSSTATTSPHVDAQHVKPDLHEPKPKVHHPSAGKKAGELEKGTKHPRRSVSKGVIGPSAMNERVLTACASLDASRVNLHNVLLELKSSPLLHSTPSYQHRVLVQLEAWKSHVAALPTRRDITQAYSCGCEKPAQSATSYDPSHRLQVTLQGGLASIRHALVDINILAQKVPALRASAGAAVFEAKCAVNSLLSAVSKHTSIDAVFASSSGLQLDVCAHTPVLREYC